MLVYVSTTIDRCSPDKDQENKNRLEQLYKMATPHAISFYLPYTAYRLSDEIDVATADSVRLTNSAVLMCCDAAVVAYVPKVESWGVPEEVKQAMYAENLTNKVCLLASRDDPPFPIHLTRWLNRIPVFFSPQGASDWLRQCLEGHPTSLEPCVCGFLGDLAKQTGEWHCSRCPKSIPF